MATYIERRSSTRPVTKRQQEALDTIRRLIRDLGRAPTRRELAAALGICVTSAHFLVVALEKKGQLRRGRSPSRGIALAEQDPAAIRQALEQVAAAAGRIRLHPTHEHAPLLSALIQLREAGWEPPGGWPEHIRPRHYVKGDLL